VTERSEVESRDPAESAGSGGPLLTRREVIRSAALVGGTMAVAGAGVITARTAGATPDPTGEQTVRDLTVLDNVPAEVDEDVLLRMQRELVKAMAKPVEERGGSW
jgi:hypothetical protein